jgi:hypothetical protein
MRSGQSAGVGGTVFSTADKCAVDLHKFQRRRRIGRVIAPSFRSYPVSQTTRRGKLVNLWTVRGFPTERIIDDNGHMDWD